MSINKNHIDESWTLFLDRDGVINERIFGGYIERPEDFVFLDGVLDAIAGFTEIVGRIIVVTNQQGVGKNIMTKRNLLSIHDYMVEAVANAGGRIDKIYFASNLRGEDNDRRKPTRSMGLEAKKDFPSIDFDRSIMVGDTDSDIQFGKNLGMLTVRIETEEPIGLESDLKVDSLLMLYNKIKK